MAENFNISPDMINNLVNMLKNNGFSEKINDSSSNPQSKEDSSVNFEKTDKGSTDSDSSTNIDFETILKMKSIMDTLNSSNDQDSKLLYSLKPYLRKSRQAKLDQYINILKITQISKIFGTKSENS